MTAHRYWRVYAPANPNAAQCSCAELSLYDVTGSLVGSGTPSASSASGGNVAGSAFDGNTATYWQSSGGYPAWIEYDFGSSSYDVIQVQWTPRSGGLTESPPYALVQHSDDGSTWADAWYFVAIYPWSSVQLFHKITYSGGYRYWRIVSVASQGGTNVVSLSEIKWNVGGYPTDLTPISAVTADASAAATYPYMVGDQSTATYWSSGAVALPHTLTFDFGPETVPNFATVTLTARNDANFAEAPTAGAIQYSTDGTTWKTAGTFIAAPWTQGSSQTFSFVVADTVVAAADAAATAAAIAAAVAEAAIPPARIIRSLCASPSFGTLGTPTFLGGSAGTSTSTAMDVTSLDGRALVAPGATIPAVGTPGRDGFFAQLADQAVRFDAAADVYAVPRHADTGTWSLSFWIGFGLTDVAQGTIFRIGDYQNTYTKGSGAPFSNFDYFEIAWRPGAISISSSYISVHTGQGNPYQLLGGLGWGKSIDTTGVASAFDPLGLMKGWAHVMLAVHPVSGRPVLTCYVNDTAVLTNFVGGFVENDSLSHAITDETWPVPFSLVDATDIDTGTASHNCIGGAEIGSTSFTRGLCLLNCMTEFWFAPGQYIDWSVAGNRQLFHTSDLAGLSWTPVNLGKDGSTPTGTKPMMYNTGGPTRFPINRATGKFCRVRHDSSYAGGFENILPICEDGGPS